MGVGDEGCREEFGWLGFLKVCRGGWEERLGDGMRLGVRFFLRGKEAWTERGGFAEVVVISRIFLGRAKVGWVERCRVSCVAGS